jgi:chromosome segregation ATPase
MLNVMEYIAALKRENDQLKQLVDYGNQRRSEIQAEHDQLKQLVDYGNQRRSEIQAEHDQLERTRLALERELVTVDGKLIRQRDDYEQRLDAAQAELKMIDLTNQQLRSSLVSCRAEITQRGKELEASAAELHESALAYNDACGDLRRKNARISQLEHQARMDEAIQRSIDKERKARDFDRDYEEARLTESLREARTALAQEKKLSRHMRAWWDTSKLDDDHELALAINDGLTLLLALDEVRSVADGALGG